MRLQICRNLSTISQVSGLIYRNCRERRDRWRVGAPLHGVGVAGRHNLKGATMHVQSLVRAGSGVVLVPNG